MGLHNLYGPTEAAIDVSYWDVPQGGEEVSLVPIGRPVANTRLYVLDKTGKLVPEGVAGELCIAGVQVARGYLNREELTEEKFVADPFSNEPGARMYRTGDLVRWLADGELEYLGRFDDQVKVRGYRIEPGEVESALGQCEGVRQAVVIAKEDATGNRRLVGYVVAEAFDRETITKELKRRLPEYMVPSLLVELEELPLTSNGKVNRKALPEVDAGEVLGNSYVAPRNETEARLAKIWQELLGVERVGVEDNFFELGGDSIITIQLVSRARRAGFSLQPRDVFEHQIIASLAAVAQPEVAIQAEQGVLTGEAGLLPIQQWFFQQELEEPHHFNQSLLLKVNKELSAETWGRAVKVLVTHHDALRFAYPNTHGIWKQEYGSQAGELLVEDLSSVSQHELSSRVEELSTGYQQSLDLEKGELLRVVLLKTPAAEKDNRLLLTIHHLAVDGVSWRILLEDLEQILLAISNGNEVEPGTKGSSYRQWYSALQRYAVKRAIRQQGYWQKVSKAEFRLPVDKVSAEPVLIADKQNYTVSLDTSLTQALLTEANQAYHTQINDLLLAALARTLGAWSQQKQVVIGMEGHGREDIAAEMDISRTVGWFTNLYPVLLSLEEDLTASDLIKSVKEQLRQVPDKGLGYGALRYLHPEAKVRESLTGQESELVFNYLGQLDNTLNSSRWFAEASELCGKPASPANKAGGKISVNGSIAGGQLSLSWSYSTKHFHKETIERLATHYLEALSELIVHCQEKQVPEHTPSDYGLGGKVTYRELEKFLQTTTGGKPLQEQISSLYSLSPLQEGLLFHGLYDRESPAYVEQMSCRITGLQVEPFRESWQYLVKKHSILRSSFHQDMSMPVQCVHKEVELPFRVLDYRNLTEAEQQVQISSFKEADSKEGFDFSQAPLLRLTLIRLSEKAYEMVWTHHHLLVDGWSMPILMQEFLSTYEALSTGEAPSVIVEDRYEDFIQYLQKQDTVEAENFWRDYLDGVEEATLLPFVDSKRDRTKGGVEYRKEELLLEDNLHTALQDFAQKNRLTVNTMIQGVWAYLLSCYTGQDDPVYGVTVAGRPTELAGSEMRVGLYINTLPLRTSVKGEQQVSEWLAELQEGHSKAREHSYTPLPSIQHWLGVKGDLFDTLMVFENYPMGEVFSHEWALQVEGLQVDEHTNYPLSIMVQAGRQLSVEFGYNAALISEATVKRIKGHFVQVLQQTISQPNLTLSQLELVTDEERQQLVTEFNHTAVPYPKEKTLVSMLEEQIAKAPGAVAAIFQGKELTYGELNRRANQLANYLRKLGVGPETLVPICIDRSLDMLVGLWGILKAGGAYVPIDPAYPEERIQFMLEDTKAALILCSVGNARALRRNASTKLLFLDREWFKIAKESSASPAVELLPTHLAYVIYTSGSTGKPKGVMVEHTGVVNLALSQAKALRLKARDRSLQFASIGFDASCYEIFNTLLSGGCLVIPTKEDILSAESLSKLIKENNIAVVTLPPSYQHVIKEELSTLKTVVSAGEALNVELAKLIQSKGIRLVNAYGPTENTVCVSLSDDPVLKDGTVTIGKPLQNVQTYVLDKTGKLLPIGVPGELCVGGVQVARGYMNREELTNEKFVPDQFRQEAGARMYRTGDLARWLPDGNLEYLGRIDDQVKIRGYRIEPGEVEHVLSQCEGVRQAVVLVRTDTAGNKRLIGYVVPSGEFDREYVVRQLKDRLPEYMVPSVLLELEEIPLTSSGKVNKKALLEAEAGEVLSSGYVAPRNETEEKLTIIWQELLQLERVGVEDNFFELGGDSLLAIRLSTKVKHTFGVKDLPIVHLFKNPTIAQLAEVIREKVEADTQNEQKHLVLLQPEGSGKPIFIVPGIYGISDTYHELASALGAKQPVYGLRMQGVLEGETPLTTVEEIAARNIAWLKTVQPEGPYSLIGHSFGGVVLYEMVRQLEQQGQGVNMAAIIDATPVTKIDDTEKRNQIAYLVEQLFEKVFEVTDLSDEWKEQMREELPLASFEELNAYVKHIISRRGLTFNNTALLERIFHVLFANMHMDYHPKEKVKQKLILAKAQESNRQDADPSLGWAEYTKMVHVVVSPGNHYSMLEGANARKLVAALQEITRLADEGLFAKD
ncbi:MAG: amino acid adenylation domain-containing protein [Hymenobacteraceae bacterium]|nr:amino acid adenylation domain-containing protein [Hymenobacteraceae bacterium]MDX5421141.1 amino acid adenylation domain-containing protein [Hymenobacteraceae bacterium]